MFITTKELAWRWKISISSLKQWRISGKGPPHHKFGGRVLYKIKEIEQYEREKLKLHTSMK